jgi:hypothetical protein
MQLSNLPSTVTSRDIDALCESARKSDHLFDCSRCLQEIHDYHEVSHYRVNGEDVCGECVNHCGCATLDDKHFPAKVYEVQFREWVNDGKLGDPMCPTCAANEIVGEFLEDSTFDADDYPGEWGKDAIAQLLAKAFPLPGKDGCDAT